MKYLFSKDRADRIDDIYSAEDMFAADDMPEGMYDCLESREKKLEEIVMRYRLPPALCWIRRICSVVAVVAAAGLVRGLDTVTLAQAYHNAPAVFWGGGCALAAAGILFAAEKILGFRMERSEDTRIAVKHFEDAEKAVEEYHGIPGDAAKMDVLAGPFKDAMNGTEVADAAVLREMTLFRRGGDLCLFDGIHMYVLPLGAACIRLVEQPIPLSSVSWNKSDKPAKKQYRQCGVVVRNDILEGLLFCCALELCHGGEEYRLLFPAYELSAMERLTELEAPALPSVSLADRMRRRGKKGRAFPEHRFPSPRFYWWPPRDEVRFWFTDTADFVFRSKYPVLYIVLGLTGFALCILPAFLFALAAFRLLGAEHDWRVVIGFAGGIVVGIGLFNIVAAWMHQYFGHVVTLLCFLLGAAMMAVGWRCLL